MGYTQLQKV